MASEASAPSLLLALPDLCLVAVLQCCAVADQHSLFSAARAHSRLHQAAVLALRKFTTVVRAQQQMDDVVLYLSKHSHNVNSIELAGPEAASMQLDRKTHQLQLHAPSLQQLPPNLQLGSLQLERLCLQLQPGAGFQGVLGGLAVAALKELSIKGCKVVDDHYSLTEAFEQLPTSLEQLSIDTVCASTSRSLPTTFLQQLQQLTYLEIAGVSVHGRGKGSHAWQPLQDLTRLVDLRINCANGKMSGAELVTTSMLSSMQRLTRLELCCTDKLESGLGLEIARRHSWQGAAAAHRTSPMRPLRLRSGGNTAAAPAGTHAAADIPEPGGHFAALSGPSCHWSCGF
jgi:hypothetical protein